MMKNKILLIFVSLVLVIACVSCAKKTIIEEIVNESIISNDEGNDSAVSDQGQLIQSGGNNTTDTSEETNSSSKNLSVVSNNVNYPAKKTTITLSHWLAGGTSEKTSVTTVINQLQKEYKNITVKVNFISGDYSTKMYANLAANKEPDVFMVADGDFGKWVRANVLEDLSPFIKTSNVIDTSKIWDSAISRYSYNGSVQGKGDIYAVPKDISPRALFYNKDLLKKYGVSEPSKTTPMTYDEFVTFLKKVTNSKDGVWGIPQLNWEGLIRSYGTSLLTSDYKRSNLNDTVLQDVFQKFSDLINVYKVVPPSSQLGSEGALIMFQTQKAVCFDGATYNLVSARDFSFDWDVCPLPGGIKNPYSSGYTGSVGYSVSKNSKEKKAAYLVAEYFAGETAQKILTSIGFNIPLYKDMANSSVFIKAGQKPSNISVFVKAAEYQQPLDSVFTDNDQWYSVLSNRLQPLWNDPSVKASDLLTKIKPEIDALLH